MKNSWKLFIRDLKNIGKNWVALILIGGLILLPSLYAWLNVKASWDPYGQTDQVPVGIVNEDNGAMVRDTEIAVGNELVDQLKEDDTIDWKFTTRKKAMEKVEYGDYYAVIVIPEDFSEKLSTVIEDHPSKATIQYYVNEKINAITPNITEKGASVIVDRMSSQFTATVNGVIFSTFNDIGLEIEKNLPDIEQFENYVFTLEESLPEINDLLNETLTDANNAEDIIDKVQSKIPEAAQITNKGLTTIDETTSFLTEAEKRLHKIAPKINEDLEKIQATTKDFHAFTARVQETDIPFSEELHDQSNERINETIDTLAEVENTLRQLNENNKEQNSDRIDTAIQEVTRLKAELQLVQKEWTKLEESLGQKQSQVDEWLNRLNKQSESASVKVDEFVKTYKEQVEPTVLQKIDETHSTLLSARNILEDTEATLPQIDQMLNRTNSNLSEGKLTLEQVMNEFPYIHHEVDALAERIRKIQAETDINEIIELLKNDPEAEKSFFEEPVKLNENKIFPIDNYGTGMTAFYTVLAIWVGALLLISLLTTDVKANESFTQKQIYFGRLFTFLTIGILQTFIVTMGDYFIIGVNINSPAWFVIFGVFISIVFMTIVYTLVSVFGDVGKASAIVLLVLQIAGSGGTYPVVLLPEFFQAVHPFLPFTYAIDLMREAVGGIVWKRALSDLSFLGTFGVIALLVGVLLKGPINKQTNKLMKKSKETGLFH